MTINNIKDLEAVISLCRRKGVQQLTLGALSLTLGDKPERKVQVSTGAEETTEPMYTDEQLLLWSSSAPIDNEDLNG